MHTELITFGAYALTMELSWNEIKDRAINFQAEWALQLEQSKNISSYEKSNASTFLIHFFEVFGIDKKRVAQFEQSVICFAKLKNLIFFIIGFPCYFCT